MPPHHVHTHPHTKNAEWKVREKDLQLIQETDLSFFPSPGKLSRLPYSPSHDRNFIPHSSPQYRHATLLTRT